jgi:Na+-driven multidrug efflux pump
VPITFGIGVSTIPMIGMAIGSGNVARARSVAWTGGALSFVITGLIGIVVALGPNLWAGLFTSDTAVLAVSQTYFQWVGPFYGLFGLGLCLYFASQGAGKVLGVVLSGTLRLLIVAAGGYWLTTAGVGRSADGGAGDVSSIFAVIAVGMAIYGLATALAVWGSRWGNPSSR